MGAYRWRLRRRRSRNMGEAGRWCNDKARSLPDGTRLHEGWRLKPAPLAGRRGWCVIGVGYDDRV